MKEKKFLNYLLLTTIFFNVWFPKAGIKIAGIPFTIGNIMYGLCFISWLFRKVKGERIHFSRIHLLIFILSFYSIMRYAFVGDIKSNIGYIIPLSIYPFIYYVMYDLVETESMRNSVVKIISYGFFFLSFYSLLQYFLGIEKVCIPGLTVNYSDYATYGSKWYLYKNNYNSIGTKIIGTYQNGNLFGVNLLMLYPIVYDYYKNNYKKQMLSLVLFIVCVFLTLSRSCWLGIILFIFFGIVFKPSKTKKSFLNKFLVLLLFVVVIISSFHFFPSIASRFTSTDKSTIVKLSGRTDGLLSVYNNFVSTSKYYIWLIGSHGFIENIGVAYEITPLAILVQVGLIGLLLFCSIIFRVLSILNNNKNDSFIFFIKLSLIVWILVGIVEGAFWLPPTAINLFMIIGLGTSYLKCKE